MPAELQLPQDLYSEFSAIRWFANVGAASRSGLEFPFQIAQSREDASLEFTSMSWHDVKTEAQGDLTGYLAKNHPDLYGSHWNNLARQSRALLDQKVRPAVAQALSAAGLPEDWLGDILVDLSRFALEEAYRRCAPRTPIFFERIFLVYEAGRLPCGWTRAVEDWPAGELLVL